jgi:hypothetical protein
VLAKIELQLPSPIDPGPPRVETNDLGLLVCVRPIDTVTHDGPGPQLHSLGGLRLEASFALSSRNHDDASFDDGPGISPTPVAREKRQGFAVHASTGFPPAWHSRIADSGLAWLSEGLTPFLSGGFAWERTKESVPGTEDERRELSKGNLYGAELIVANVLSLRWGYVHSEDWDIDEATWGLGLGFSLGGFLGVRYDHASSPQAAGLADRRDQGVTAYVDVLALAQLLQSK